MIAQCAIILGRHVTTSSAISVLFLVHIGCPSTTHFLVHHSPVHRPQPMSTFDALASRLMQLQTQAAYQSSLQASRQKVGPLATSSDSSGSLARIVMSISQSTERWCNCCVQPGCGHTGITYSALNFYDCSHCARVISYSRDKTADWP